MSLTKQIIKAVFRIFAGSTIEQISAKKGNINIYLKVSSQRLNDR